MRSSCRLTASRSTAKRDKLQHKTILLLLDVRLGICCCRRPSTRVCRYHVSPRYCFGQMVLHDMLSSFSSMRRQCHSQNLSSLDKRRLRATFMTHMQHAPGSSLTHPHPHPHLPSDDGVPGEAKNGRDNHFTRKLRRNCSSCVPKGIPRRCRRPPRLPNNCRTILE